MNIAIIGAGPIGLYAAMCCEKMGINYDVFESSGIVGGQLTHLYPQKEIVNIPGIEKITAEGYINLLMSCIDHSKVHLNTKIDNLGHLNKTYDYIIVAAGIGDYMPRKLGLQNEDKCNVLYSVTDPEMFRGKRIVIFGGGDSALDWAAQLSDIADYVFLVHRRDEFRGNADTIKGKQVDCYMSYTPDAIEPGIVDVRSVKEDHVISLTYDYVLVNFGMIYSKQEFEKSEKVFFVGDYLDQTKTIAFGIESVNKIFSELSL